MVVMWDKAKETMTRSQIESLQLEKLKTLVTRVYDRVPAYRAKMDAAGVKPKHIQALKDLALLPFTVKDDLRANYPFGLFA